MSHAFRTLATVAAAAVAVAFAAAATAADYPTRPIRMLVGFTPSSATDIVARAVGQKLSERLGQPVVIDNRTGAGGTLASEATAKASPDGYTVLMASSAFTITPAVYSNLKFDVEKDFTPIIFIGALPTVLLVNNTVPAKTLQEFIQYAKSRPARLNFGSSGVGGSTHLGAELLASTIGIKMNHVPYRGNPQATTALLGGEINVLMDTLLLAAQTAKGTPDRVRALAVTGQSRSPLLPDVPTFAEAGLPQYDASIWFGVLGPARMPKQIVARLNSEIAETLKTPEVRSRLATSGGIGLVGGSSAQFNEYMRAELAKWKRIAHESNIKAE